MKLLPTLRPRERRLALAGIAIFVCWMVVLIGVDPLWRRVTQLRQHIQRQTDMAQELKLLLDEGPAVEHRYQEAGPYLKQNGGQAGGQDNLLDELEALSRTSGVQLNLKPLAPKAEERFKRLLVEVDIEGSQSQVLGFLDAVFRLPRLIVLDRLRLSAVPANESRLRANLVLQHLLFTQPL